MVVTGREAAENQGLSLGEATFHRLKFSSQTLCHSDRSVRVERVSSAQLLPTQRELVQVSGDMSSLNSRGIASARKNGSGIDLEGNGTCLGAAIYT
jgi:hypothetical protein